MVPLNIEGVQTPGYFSINSNYKICDTFSSKRANNFENEKLYQENHKLEKCFWKKQEW